MLNFRLTYSFGILLIGLLLLGVGESAHAQDQTGGIYVAEVEGVINPPVANYVARVLNKAESDNAMLVIIEIDTPGGLDSSMREIIQATLRSPVPVAVYVTPSGGRAASAGLFILLAGDFAAMAPNTNTGAASPVGLGGSGDDTALAKAENDAAALIRSLAERRNRNIDWAEQAVREAVSANEEEALDQNIIDVIAVNRDDLIRQLDGARLEKAGTTITLDLANAPVREVPMALDEQILHIISDPNIAFVLLSIGSIGIIAELYNPGTLFPGITGVIALIIAFYSLGNLPTNWAGVALIVVAMVLLVAELNTDGIGILATGGIVAFVLGALILFRPFQPDSVATPSLRVNPWLLGATTAAMLAFFGLVIRQIVQARWSPLQTGYEQFVGQTAKVRHDIDPKGRVWFQGQSWFARTQSGETVTQGKTVQIVDVDNLTLIVEPIELEDEVEEPTTIL